jgi:type II secretory pathway pseudopilin PulG
MKPVLRTLALVVLGLVIVFGALRGFVLLHADESRHDAEARDFLQRAAQALGSWYAENAGRYPDSLAALGLEANNGGFGPTQFYGGLLRSPLGELGAAWKSLRRGHALDPWGRPWIYEACSAGSGARLRSAGADAERTENDVWVYDLTVADGLSSMAHMGHPPLWP